MNKLILGDCLEVMKDIKTESVDMILTDLPYGTTYAKWDSVIPVDKLWEQYKRLIKPHGAIVLFGIQPFSSLLVGSNTKMFKYQWVWDKEHPTNFANAKRQPLKQHEDILVFYEGQCTYNPQMTIGKTNHKQGNSITNSSDTRLINKRSPDKLDGLKYPKSILKFPKHSSQVGLHPTQKSLALCEYLIKTYTNEGEQVLDSCMGSGTTIVAAERLNRDYVGIEISTEYMAVAMHRLKSSKKGADDE